MYDYDLNEIKEALTIEQVFDLLNEFHGEPILKGETIISKTICHHDQDDLAEAGHKLYYYENSHLFRCYTGCEEPVYDIFELVRKVRKCELPQAVQYVAQYFGFSGNSITDENPTSIDDYLTSINSYDRIKNIDTEKQIVELKTYDDSFLKNLPHPIIASWVEENISETAMKKYEIAFDPMNQGIVIPHRDINGNLIGVRERILDEQSIERYGKYLPMRVGKKMYNHPLSFSLYGILQNQENIRQTKKAIVIESEKSVLQLENILQGNNISVACCGSNLINYQVQLLLSLGAEEIIVGFDHDWHDVTEDGAKRKIRNLKNIQKKYGNYVKLSYLWDKDNLTGYKSSPSDCGGDIFWKLMKERVNLY